MLSIREESGKSRVLSKILSDSNFDFWPSSIPLVNFTHFPLTKCARSRYEIRSKIYRIELHESRLFTVDEHLTINCKFNYFSFFCRYEFIWIRYQKTDWVGKIWGFVSIQIKQILTKLIVKSFGKFCIIIRRLIVDI